MLCLESSKPTNRIHLLMTDPPYVALRHGCYRSRSVTHGLRQGRSIHGV
jgi:hypothetical protein